MTYFAGILLVAPLTSLWSSFDTASGLAKRWIRQARNVELLVSIAWW